MAYTPRQLKSPPRAARVNFISEIRQRLSGGLRTVAEIIGRDFSVIPFWNTGRRLYTVDSYRTDYRFWDELRNCKSLGYQRSGLLCKPITQIIASYALGDRPTYTLMRDEGDDIDEERADYTDAALTRFIQQNHATLLLMLEDDYALGDQYVIVNADGTLSLPSPDTVDVKRDPLYPQQIMSVTVETRFKGTLIRDEYRLDGRTVRWMQAGKIVHEEQYENLIGRLPVVHFANDRRSNELYGRPIYESLLTVLGDYDDLLIKALDGTRLMGNPMPTFEGMENLQETVAANSTPTEEQYTDPDGNLVQRPLIAFDTLAAVFVGKGGRFDFKHPAIGFTEDMRRMLETLFNLIIDHTRIAEVLWGASVASSRASTEVQMPPFVKHIQARRIQLDGERDRGGMYDLIDVFLRTKALTDRKIVVAPTQSQWASIALEDQNVKLQKTVYARGVGLLDKTTTLDKLDLVPNPRQAVEDAEAEIASQPDDFMTALNAAAHKDMNPTNGTPNTPNNPDMTDATPPDPDGGRNVKVNGKPIGELELELIA